MYFILNYVFFVFIRSTAQMISFMPSFFVLKELKSLQIRNPFTHIKAIKMDMYIWELSCHSVEENCPFSIPLYLSAFGSCGSVGSLFLVLSNWETKPPPQKGSLCYVMFPYIGREVFWHVHLAKRSFNSISQVQKRQAYLTSSKPGYTGVLPV